MNMTNNKKFIVTGNGFIKITVDGVNIETLFFSNYVLQGLIADGFIQVYD